MYFSKFPTTIFDRQEVTDITRKVQLKAFMKENALAYMNYTVQDGERPEDVAYYYYDDPAYAWLVLTANDIVDPYTQWPKTDRDLQKMINVKYRFDVNSAVAPSAIIVGEEYKILTPLSNSDAIALEIADNREGVVFIATQAGTSTMTTGTLVKAASTVETDNWSKNSTIGNNIVFYRSVLDPDIKLNRSSFYFVDDEEKSEFFPVRAYEYEVELNEERKEIVLANKGLLPIIQNQLSELINA